MKCSTGLSGKKYFKDISVNNLQLKSVLGITEKEIVSIYGAGGKTSLLYLLASELSGSGNKVVVTTTTKIFQNPNIPLVLTPRLSEAKAKLQRLLLGRNPLILAENLYPGGKLKGIDPSWPGRLIEQPGLFCILGECDGAAGRSLKGYASFEPVLPPDSSIILPVLGLSGLGAPLNSKQVHRPEQFSQMVGIKMGETVRVEHLIRSLKWMVELGRRQAPRARVVPVLNQADLVSDIGVIKQIAGAVAGDPDLQHIIFAAARKPAPVKFIFNLISGQAVPRVSCVVLAAGFSRRMGSDKLALELGGTTVLQQTLQNIARSGISETILVINPGATGLKASLSKYNLKFAVNKRSFLGISTSLQAGLSQVAPTSQGVIFALGDQPLISARVFDNLLENYRRRLPLAVFPTCRGCRGNPVLFDRRTWPLLMELEGDRGGSQLLSRLPAEELLPVEMEMPEILVDLDTPGDYEAILNRFKTGADE